VTEDEASHFGIEPANSWTAQHGRSSDCRAVLAAAYVVAFGVLLIAVSLGGIGIVHGDAQTAVLVVGCLLAISGIILRPSKR